MQARKGFLIGATAGRTTLNGEGLQHQDGHSHLLASSPRAQLLAYDPAYAYELAVIIQDGDGYGRSDNRSALRDFFEVDARHIAFASLSALARAKRVKPAVVEKARRQLEIDPGKARPLFA
jgi:pyruvate dehydrogenase complex dehydrogenase (E1) component